MKILNKIRELFSTYAPGLLLLLVIALAATFLAQYLPSFIGKVFIAVILGIVIANIFRPKKEIFAKGIKLGLSKLLKLAIILMGAGISFGEVASLGAKGILIIVVLICIVFGLVFLIGKFLGVSLRRKILIAVGVCICGNTAIVTAAPLIEAKDEEIAMAVGIVTLFGVIGVLTYPLIGTALSMRDTWFGAWAGTAINDTSQVVAAGFIYSDAAGEVATTIKLVRNIMIVPVVLLVAFFYRKNATASSGEKQKINIIKIFPMFILGFLLFALLNSVGVFTPAISDTLVQISKFIILLALSGIGLGVDFKKFKAIGIKPFILGFSVEVLLAVIAIFATKIVFGA